MFFIIIILQHKKRQIQKSRKVLVKQMKKLEGQLLNVMQYSVY